MENSNQFVDLLVMEFIDSAGQRVDQLSRTGVNPQQIQAALQFMKKDCSITISLQSVEMSPDGRSIIHDPLLSD